MPSLSGRPPNSQFYTASVILPGYVQATLGRSGRRCLRDGQVRIDEAVAGVRRRGRQARHPTSAWQAGQVFIFRNQAGLSRTPPRCTPFALPAGHRDGAAQTLGPFGPRAPVRRPSRAHLPLLYVFLAGRASVHLPQLGGSAEGPVWFQGSTELLGGGSTHKRSSMKTMFVRNSSGMS